MDATTNAIDRVALAIASQRGFKYNTRETTKDDLLRVFGQQLFEEARAAIEVMKGSEEKMDVLRDLRKTLEKILSHNGAHEVMANAKYVLIALMQAKDFLD